MTSTNVIVFISLISFFVVLASSSVDIRRPKPQSSSSTVSNSSKQVEVVTRLLNSALKSNTDTVLGPNSSSVSVPRLPEKNFNFNFLQVSDATIEYLRDHAGYYDLSTSIGARMFFFFFESQNNIKDPVVIWLDGGPGSSGCVTLFYGNGPCYIDEDLSLKLNENSWNKVSHIIYVDQPIGTGSTYTTNANDIRDNLNAITNDFYCFIQKFFKEHPMLADNDFFIAGSSYAGHYAPSFANKLLEEKKTPEEFQIKLRGIAIGNGLVNSIKQYPTLPFYAYYNNIIKESDYLHITKILVPRCERAAKTCNSEHGSNNDCLVAYHRCQAILEDILETNTTVNYYDIRKTRQGTTTYDFSKMKRLLNSPSIKKALKLPTVAFEPLNGQIYTALLTDFMKNYDAKIATLLKNGINVLIYVGDQDLMCNIYGNIQWALDMEWSGKEGFENAKPVPFRFEEKPVGMIRKYGPLTFLKIHDAGHMVVMDQPEITLHMIRSWM